MALHVGVRPEKIQKVEKKLYQILIVGKQKVSMSSEDPNEDENANKLDIEREALISRFNKENESKEIYQAVSEQLTQTVIQTIIHRLAEPRDVLAYAGIDDIQITLLELLQIESPDLNRVCKQVERLNWLSDDLINMVNSAAFRHRRPKGSDVKVRDLKLVLSYIGMENLQTFIPYSCVKKWLPAPQANLHWLTRKLWRFITINGVAAQALAKKYNKDSVFSYIGALLYQLGSISIINNSASVFTEIRDYWLNSAKEMENEDIADAITATEIPAQFIYEKVTESSGIFNWQLLELINFEGSKQIKLLKELYSTSNYVDLSEYAALIARANCFAKILFLEEQHKLYPQERELLCDYYQLDDDEMSLLRNLNYHQLDIV